MIYLLEEAEELGFCGKTANIWQAIGYVVLVLKIVIPLILIVLGMVDLGKAVISNEDKAISKNVQTLVKRFVAAIVIFFVPMIVSTLFSLVLKINLTENGKDRNKCLQCVVDAKGATCEDAVKKVPLKITN